MDSRENLVFSEDAPHTIAPNMQWDLELSVPSLVEVKEECIDEKSPWGDFMGQPEVISESTEYKLDYESEYDDTLQQLKMEFYEEESAQSSCSSGNRIGFENEEILKYMGNQESQNNNAEEGFFLNVKVKDEDKMYQVRIKTERLEEQVVLDNADEDTSVHYDVLVTPEEVQCKWCNRIFKNNFDLLKHNIGHIKFNINIKSANNKADVKNNKLRRNKKGKDETDKVYHCKECNSVMMYSNSQRHIETVHSIEEFQCNICGKRFRCVKYLQKHMFVHTPGKSDSSVVCQHCDKVFKHKYNLYCHVRNCHSNERLKCDMCDGVFKSKPYLLQHIKRIHQDYGRLFVCWCGKEFLTPRRLGYHKRAQHG